MKALKTAFIALAMMPAAAMAYTVCSPNDIIRVTVDTDNGQPTYTVTYEGVTVIEKSPLGMVTNIGDYSKGLQCTGTSEVKEIIDTYSLPNIKKSNVVYRANTGTVDLGRDGKTLMSVTFNVDDNNVAYRYSLKPVGDTRSVVIEDEVSGFVFPDGTTTYMCPQMQPMTGFARTAPSYETNYTLDDEPGKNGWGDGYTFPCLVRTPSCWVLVSETGLDGSYCGSHLANVGGTHYKIAFPNPAELNGTGSSTPLMSLQPEALTPWRTITIGATLDPIAETTIPFDVVKPKYEASKPYEYSKGSWSWIIKMDPSCNFEEQKRYIDFSAEMGYNTVLVDAMWDTQIGYDKMEELARYGKSKGVDLYLWYNSNGSWNDAPQGPRGRMDRSHQRREEMAWMQRNGIRGIKVDFFGGDKQQMIQLYEDILSDANDYGIMVIFHGCTLPRGWERMYPNFASAEAVLASENLHFSQGMCDAEASNATIHPLVRNTVGSMDFGGSTLNKWYNADNAPGRGTQRRTSDVFALATAVLFQSPVQHFAMAPNNLTDAPQWAVEFMKAVPTTWDDVDYIDGEPGKFLIMARRHGDKWYVAGINARDEPVKGKTLIPVLAPGTTVTLYCDDADLNGSVKTVKVNKNREVDLFIPKNGAFVIVQ